MACEDVSVPPVPRIHSDASPVRVLVAIGARDEDRVRAVRRALESVRGGEPVTSRRLGMQIVVDAPPFCSLGVLATTILVAMNGPAQTPLRSAAAWDTVLCLLRATRAGILQINTAHNLVRSGRDRTVTEIASALSRLAAEVRSVHALILTGEADLADLLRRDPRLGRRSELVHSG